MKNRKRNRFQHYDYSKPGYYFITICVKGKLCCFGEIVNGVMDLSDIGKKVSDCWNNVPKHFPHAQIDEVVIMPNHIHGIIIIGHDLGNKDFCSLPNEGLWQKYWARSLSSVVRGFKVGVTKWCRKNNFGDFEWQKSYYDHVIRSDKALARIRRYIHDNPLKWGSDEYYW